jgi:hypothetical protein
VCGELDALWRGRLEGMAVTVDHYESHTVTTISGQQIDHEALERVLETLRDLHLPLVSVERLEP